MVKKNNGKCVVKRSTCVEVKGCACVKSACEDGAGMRRKMAQVKLACRLASARLNAVRCGGGMTRFSHHSGYTLDDPPRGLRREDAQAGAAGPYHTKNPLHTYIRKLNNP